MMDLAMRLFQKSSAAPSPYHSGRATPQAHKNFMHVSKSKEVDETDDDGLNMSVAEFQAMRKSQLNKKSVVFRGATANPNSMQMLQNISEGVRRSSATLPIIPPTPMRKNATGSKRESAVSFGELRQALQEAVEEQKSLGTGSEKESITNSAAMSKGTSVTRSQSSGSSGHQDR